MAMSRPTEWMDFNHARPTENSHPDHGDRRDDGLRDRDRQRAELSISVEAFDHVSTVATVGAVADISIDATVADLSVAAADAALVAADHNFYLAFHIDLATVDSSTVDLLAKHLFVAAVADPHSLTAYAAATARSGES
jgi:hypothetical protein